jgi:type IX secretion system PorP/SprF family membrane protein
MRRILPAFSILATLFFQQGMVFAQDAPVFSQFFANPYQFNPSYVAHNGYAEANIFYRKQWLNIENAPTVGAFNIQAPFGRNVALGLSVYSNKTVLLQTNAALATFGYRINTSRYSHLDFGLSGGLSMNNFDLEAVANLNDPALANVVQKSQFLNGQAGFNYQFKNFNIGFAFTKLLDSSPASINTFDQIKFDPFKNKFFSMSYNFEFTDVEISPIFLYRAIDNAAIQGQWEAMVIAKFRKIVWVGASYRDGYGITGFLGFSLSSFKFGYAYEHPTGSISKASSGSHEVYLGTQIGKRNRNVEIAEENAKKDSLRELAKNTPVVEKPKVDTVKTEEPKVVVTPVEQKPVSAPVEEKPAVVTQEPAIVEEPVVQKPAKEYVPQAYELPKNPVMEGFFVVYGAFRSSDNADKLVAQMKAEGVAASVIFGDKKKYYYVFTYQSKNRHEALVQLGKAKSNSKFPGIWIMDSTKDK